MGARRRGRKRDSIPLSLWTVDLRTCGNLFGLTVSPLRRQAQEGFRGRRVSKAAWPSPHRPVVRARGNTPRFAGPTILGDRYIDKLVQSHVRPLASRCSGRVRTASYSMIKGTEARTSNARSKAPISNRLEAPWSLRRAATSTSVSRTSRRKHLC